MTPPARTARGEQRGPITAASAPKAQRADARRNRARVLAAADIVFANQGVAASTEEVAREAGVGIGTVFRHFPKKEALLEAVIVHRLRRFAAEAAALAADDAADPGEAFFALIARGADQSVAKSAAAAVLAESGVDVAAATGPIFAAMRHSLATMLTRAQAAGAVRGDVSVDDVLALLIGAARAAEFTGWDRASMARAVAVICDGLRPPGAGVGVRT